MKRFKFWLVIFDEELGVSITVAGGDFTVGSVPYTLIDVSAGYLFLSFCFCLRFTWICLMGWSGGTLRLYFRL